MQHRRSPRAVTIGIYSPVFLVLCLFTWSLWAVPFSYGQTSDLVRARVDVTQRVMLSGHHPSWAVASNDAGAVPDDVALGRLTRACADAAAGNGI
jgi:hypothetical protein